LIKGRFIEKLIIDSSDSSESKFLYLNLKINYKKSK